MILNSQNAYKQVLDETVQPGSRWLDIGCGRSILPDWMRDSIEIQRDLVGRCEIARGCDPVDDRQHVAGLDKYVGDCSVLPYEDGAFNLVTANMVVEHIEDPAAFLQEVSRVLSTSGTFVFHTPNLGNPLVFLAGRIPHSMVRMIAKILDGREHEDIFPTFYRMNTRKDIADFMGFDLVNIQYVPTQVFWKVPVLRTLEAMWIDMLPQRRHSNLIVTMRKSSSAAVETNQSDSDFLLVNSGNGVN